MLGPAAAVTKVVVEGERQAREKNKTEKGKSKKKKGKGRWSTAYVPKVCEDKRQKKETLDHDGHTY